MAPTLAARVERNPDRNAWLIAWALTLALHALLVVLIRGIPPPAPPKMIRRIEPIRLVFAKPGAETRKPDEPHIFTELPPDRADQAPKHPDFLSNVTSRARDQTPGGDDAMPRMNGEVDAPMVKLHSDGGAAALAMPMRNLEPSEPAFPREPRLGAGATTTPKATESATNRAVTEGTSRAAAGSAGSSDIDQPEMDNPNGNAALTGDVSLSTIAWDYAPWLERFGRQLMRRWIPPPAYSLGILKEGGWAVIQIEISRSGELLSLQVLEEHGHPSLSTAAQGALRSMAPIERLPADFPEPTLRLRIRMIYPRIHPR